MLRTIDKIWKFMYNNAVGYMMFKKLAQRLSADREKQSSVAINPFQVDFENRKSLFLNKMTQTAVNMYERQADIKKFTKLVLSDPENKSHNKLVDALFSHGIVNVEDEENLKKLSNNTKFLNDLGLVES